MSRGPDINFFKDLVALAVLVLGFLAKKRAGEKKASSPRAPAASSASPEAEERGRRIQDEIRRKIAARQSGSPLVSARTEGPPPASARTDAETWGRASTRLSREEVSSEPEPLVDAPPIAEPSLVLPDAPQPQFDLAAPAPSPFSSSSPPPPARSAWAEALRRPADVRRALVLGEILGPPVGLPRR